MSQATNIDLGEIVLSGDLTGTGAYPELRASGVTPGNYAIMQKMYVDSKGRVTSVAAIPYSTVEPLLSVATTSVKGIFSPGSHFSIASGVLSADVATASAKGVFSVGAGLTASSGNITLDYISTLATGSVFGFVKSGTNLTNTAGVLSVADASSSVKGVASFGSGLSVSSGAVALNAATAPATGSVFGFVNSGTNLTNTAGVLSVADATSSVKGVASYGSDFVVSSGAVSADTAAITQNLSPATGSVFGVVKSGTNLTNTAGVLSVADATSSVKGVASFGSGLSVTSGAVSGSSFTKFANANTYSLAQNGTSTASSPSTTFTPNFQTGSDVQDLTLTSNLAINFPSTLAPTGGCVRQTIILRYNASTAYTVALSGTYLTNTTLSFTNAATSAVDVLTLICTDTVCYAMLNENFQ